jgi:hypothetical protein
MPDLSPLQIVALVVLSAWLLVVFLGSIAQVWRGDRPTIDDAPGPPVDSRTALWRQHDPDLRDPSDERRN